VPRPAINTLFTVPIRATADIVIARQHGRVLCAEIGCSGGEATLVATIISELARNILLYAKKGEIGLGKMQAGERNGIEIECRDEGPGIAEIQRALLGGYSTSGGLGMGLSGVRRLVDDFDITTGVGIGTAIKLRKWLC
jgi:serine/threonine-protein kinase RsbT